MKFNLQSKMRLIIGLMILASVALTHFVSYYWILFTLFVGLNMFQFAFTKWCLLEEILKKFEK